MAAREPTSPSPVDPAMRPFVRTLILLIGMIAIAIAASTPTEPVRFILPGVTLAYLGVAAHILKTNLRLAIIIMACGLWVGTCCAVIFFSGVHSANMISFPFITALAGWALGRRWLIALTGMATVVVVGVGLGEFFGVYTPTPRTSPIVPMLLTAPTLLLTAYIVNMAYLSLRDRENRAVEISEQLATHNVELALRESEVRELNDTLEQRVSERTSELATAMETLHRAQEELLQSEAKAALGAMVASVTHELNTPIGNSVMAASTLSDQATAFLRNVEAGHLKRSELTAFLVALRDGTDMIQRNLERAGLLLKNFKQVAADQASEQRREFDLAGLVGEVVGMLRPQLKNSPHRVVLEIPDQIVMDSYPGPLGQVLINLINNAYMHAFDGMTDGVLTLSAEARDPFVVVHVSDNGAGMSHETLTRLFQPFFSTKIGKGGTGLGMTIVEGIVRKTLGGSLHVESKPGCGTQFHITLPLSAPAF